jgi:molybdopterin synthase sulfur carrier subunit
MTYKILTFGIAKDIIGTRTLMLTIEQPIFTVADLKIQIVTLYPAFQNLHSFAIAVNTEYADDDLLLNTADEIVIIPPVSGG